MRRVAVLPPILVTAALAIVGCGGTTDNSKDFSGVKKDVATAIDDFSSHARKLEARKICDNLLTADLKAEIAAYAKKDGRGSDCADGLKDSLRDADVSDIDVQSINVSGATGTVRYKIKTSADPDPTGTLELVNQRGWRIAKLP